MLVLPPWRIVPLSVLELVERYLQAGGIVVGERPLRPQGIVPAAEEARYQQLAEKIWGGCSAAFSKYRRARRPWHTLLRGQGARRSQRLAYPS